MIQTGAPGTLMDDAEDAPLISVDPELKELLGLFDVPAFARRGQDLEHAIDRIHVRCRAQREGLLEMVQLRLRQWSKVADGPESWSGVFAGPIDGLWVAADAQPPRWADRPAPLRQRKTVARDLVASAERFN